MRIRLFDNLRKFRIIFDTARLSLLLQWVKTIASMPFHECPKRMLQGNRHAQRNSTNCKSSFGGKSQFYQSSKLGVSSLHFSHAIWLWRKQYPPPDTDYPQWWLHGGERIIAALNRIDEFDQNWNHLNFERVLRNIRLSAGEHAAKSGLVS